MPPIKDDTAKLTKKQRKTLAFRKGAAAEDNGKTAKQSVQGNDSDVGAGEGSKEEGKASLPTSLLATAKGKQKAEAPDAENAVAGDDAIEPAPRKKKEKTNKNKLPGAGKGRDAPAATTVDATKKRKRDHTGSDENQADQGKATKKRFEENGKSSTNVAAEGDDAASGSPAAAAAKASTEQRRFIVFVGNMSFKTTADELSKHFAAQCSETPTVRLLTSRGDPSKRQALSKSKQKSIAKGKAADPGAPTSKGCAFVEFASHKALQKALQFHHTQFQGRSINVELTAGGGGKGQDRKERIQKKNKELDDERRKLHEKYIKGKSTGKQGAAGEGKGSAEGTTKAVPAGPPQPQWGPRADAAGSKKGATKIPKWAASGANAIRLSG